MKQVETADRRASLRPDASGELRLNVRGELLFVHRHALLDRVARLVVDLRPARRTRDNGDRVGLRAVLDDGRGLWLGEASDVIASALAISHRICVARIERERVELRSVPLVSTLEEAPQRVDATTAGLDVLARHFESAATAVALTSRPGRADLEAPLIALAARLCRPAAVDAVG
jgi:hypothetical protein